MKRRFLGVATATMMLTGGSFFAFASSQPQECPLKGTSECTLMKAETAVKAEVPPCCKKK